MSCVPWYDSWLVIPSYYVGFTSALTLGVRYLWNKGRSEREAGSQTEAVPMTENSKNKWCEHQWIKKGKCVSCGYDEDAANGKPFVAECNCPRCSWREVHDIMAISKGGVGIVRRTCRHCGQTWEQI